MREDVKTVYTRYSLARDREERRRVLHEIYNRLDAYPDEALDCVHEAATGWINDCGFGEEAGIITAYTEVFCVGTA